MIGKCFLLAGLLAASLLCIGCSEPAPPPTGETREEAIEVHREMANREMQSIQQSQSRD